MKRWTLESMTSKQRIALFAVMVTVLAVLGVLAVMASNSTEDKTAPPIIPHTTTNNTNSSGTPAPTFNADEHLMADQVLTLVSALGGVEPTLSKNDLLASVSGYVSPEVLKQVEKSYPSDMATLKSKGFYQFVDVTYQEDLTKISKLDANQRLIVAKGDVFVSENGGDPKFLEARQWRILYTADSKGVWTITDVQMLVL